MRKFILVLLILTAGIIPVWLVMNQKRAAVKKEELVCPVNLNASRGKLLEYLRLRKDNLAVKEADKILVVWPGDTCALWAKAEVFRRAYRFEDAQKLLSQVLAGCPQHAPSLISLAYIRYHSHKFSEALKILKQVLKERGLDKEDEAMAYMLIGSINAKKAACGGLFAKLAYGIRIKGYFEKAKVLAPELPEVHLGLGTFCLLAPKIAGGDVDKAIEELEYAVNLAPDFATANARLAQAYWIKGDSRKYDLYLKKAKDLDPENEVAREIEESL
ncbi:MAG: hypothetical protein PHC54_01865 [Candidatus Omnitrophica bacterium]|nr:hypothetical protein [Candidatus Omnitrophota bacterium]MDD5591674.1 hypothetical protein [Candidatus Omnitrophota bacterium]